MAGIDNEAALIMQRYKGIEGNLYSRGQVGRAPQNSHEVQQVIQEGNQMMHIGN